MSKVQEKINPITCTVYQIVKHTLKILYLVANTARFFKVCLTILWTLGVIGLKRMQSDQLSDIFYVSKNYSEGK